MAKSTLEFLTENDWSLILAKSKRLTYAPGEEIIKQGIPGKAIYIIRQGHSVGRSDEPGRQNRDRGSWR